MRITKSIPLKLLIASLFISLSFVNSLWAQQGKSTIAKFEIYSPATSDFGFWGEGSDEYLIDLGNGKTQTIRTVDTIYAYAEKVINQKLAIQLEAQKPEEKIKMNGVGQMNLLPKRKTKDVAATGKYETIIQVNVTLTSGGSTSGGIGPFGKRKQKIDMIVEISVYDKNMKEIATYKKRTKMDEVKYSTSIFGVSDTISLSGNEIYVLFVESLENALANKK